MTVNPIDAARGAAQPRADVRPIQSRGDRVCAPGGGRLLHSERSSIELDGAKVMVMEVRAPGTPAPAPACDEHPSRKPAEEPGAKQPEPSQDELLRQMMGK